MTETRTRTDRMPTGHRCDDGPRDLIAGPCGTAIELWQGLDRRWTARAVEAETHEVVPGTRTRRDGYAHKATAVAACCRLVRARMRRLIDRLETGAVA